MHQRFFFCVALIIAAVPPCVSLRADDSAAGASPAEGQPQGLLPVPDFSGDLWTRNRLTGDWGGSRTDLANKGIQLDVNFTQTMQTVTQGGRDTGTRYGGSLDYVLTLDLMRMGVMPGALIKFRGESRYGEAANDIVGQLLPTNTDGFFPLDDHIDDDIAFALTNLTYYQFLSEQFGVFLGKIDTLDGDPNEFASGRGTSQFMNGNLVIPTSPILSVPYATLGAGIVLMPNKNITVTSVVMNTSDASTTTGFEGFGEGTTWLTEAQFQYRLGTLPGGMNIGGVYGFDNEFFALGERFVFRPGQGVSAPTKNETWAFYWSAWQYIIVEQPSDALINVLDGKQDLQGLGLFMRVGFADDDTSPLELTISGGIGGKGLIPGRDNDTCGIAYFYNNLETLRITGVADIDDKTQGFEAYYNVQLTPASHLTFDVQVLEPVQKSLDTAVVVGMRLNLRF